MNDTEPYSGIQSVEYWVLCDEQETQHEVLYSFDYLKNEHDHKGSLNIYENGQLIRSELDYEIKQEDLLNRFRQTVIINSALNNSDNVSILVKVVDNAGNETFKRLDGLRIDITAPEIEISFNTNDANVVNGRGYFDTNREAVITITERTSDFNKEKATKGIVIYAFDANGNKVALPLSMIGEWTTVESDKPDEAKHTAKVSFTTDANYEFLVSYTDEAGNECAYENVTFVDGTVSERYFTIDKIAPEASVSIKDNIWNQLLEILTFRLFSNEDVLVSADVTDATSPVIVEYYKTSEVLPLDFDALSAITEWKEYQEFTVSEDEIVVVYLRVIDYAGNYIYVSSDGYIVDKTESVIEIVLETTDKYHNDIPLYNQDVDVIINVQEKEEDRYSGLNKVTCWVVCDGKETQRETYTFETEDGSYDALTSTFSKTFTILAEANNSCDVTLYVGVTDNAGNYVEDSVKVDIDVTNPTIDVLFEDNDAYKVVENKGYFPATRKAIISITERTEHFNWENALGWIEISAEDVKGKNILENYKELITIEGTNGEGDRATHRAVIHFSLDGNYTFDLSYTDLAGNKNDSVNYNNSVTPCEFAVDTTDPEGSITVVGLGTWDKLIEVLIYKTY